MAITLQSTAFQQGEAILPRYTCDGDDISPPLSWSGAPENTRSFALICEDPDAPRGTFTHWVLWNLPTDATSLAEDVPNQEILENGVMQGLNDFDGLGYNGPCPPVGHGRHRYFFNLYALDRTLNLKPNATREQLLQAMQGHILAQGELMGTYSR